MSRSGPFELSETAPDQNHEEILAAKGTVIKSAAVPIRRHAPLSGELVSILDRAGKRSLLLVRCFMKSPSLGLLLAMLFTSLTGRTAPPSAERPNLLLIMTDQQFAEAMSCRMGSRYLHTPALDRLASGGMLFTRAYTPNPLCMPARASLFSGRYPHETRVTRNAIPPDGLDLETFVSMGIYFRKAGYSTAYSGKWHLCYDIEEPETHGFQILESRSGENHDARVSNAAVQFLRQRHDRPFLLVASFLNPHDICEWARRLAGRTEPLPGGEIGRVPAQGDLPPPPLNLSPPLDESDSMTLMRRAYQVKDGLFPVGDFTVAEWRKHRWGYYRMIEKVDAEIGKVLEALRTLGYEEETLVIFTSDHGECGGAHGFNQKTVFYEESTRVPLVISWKTRTPAGTTDRLVNTGVDILPTMLEAAGLSQPPGLPGHSLLGLALGRAPRDWPSYVVVQNDMSQSGEVEGFRPTMQGRMVRTDRYKYCLYEYGVSRESLFDLQTDPGETQNLAADPAYHHVLLEHRGLLQEFARLRGDSKAASLLTHGVLPRPFKSSSVRQPR